MTTHPLPILETLYKSVAYPWYLRKRLVIALLPTLCILVMLDIVSEYFLGADEVGPVVLIAFISLPITILYTIAIHRIMILGPESTPKHGMLGWSAREWRFLLFSVGLGVVSGFLMVIPFMAVFGIHGDDEETLLYQITQWLMWLPAAFLFARLSLVFPAIATDSSFSLLKSWQISRGNTVRLSIVLYAVPTLSFLGAVALPDIFPEQVSTYLGWLFTVAGILIGYVLWAIAISCLSFSYKYLVENRY